MKFTKVCIAIIIVTLTMCLIIACNKSNNSTQKGNSKETITAASILKKVEKRYKKETITDIRLETNTVLTKDNVTKVNIDAFYHDYFVDKDMKKCITNLKLKVVVDKIKNQLDMYINENGNVVYALNKRIYYSADDMYDMLGIKYAAPEINENELLDDNLSETEDIYKINATIEPTEESSIDETSEPIEDLNDEGINEEKRQDVNKIESTLTPRKIYSINDLNKLSNKVVIEGNKKFDGKDCYILKGIIKNNEIKNFLITYLDTNLYSLPSKFGKIEYYIYIEKKNYDIVGFSFDCSNIISTLSGEKEVLDNIVEFKVITNTGKKIIMPKAKQFSIDSYGEILTAIEVISNAFK